LRAHNSNTYLNPQFLHFSEGDTVMISFNYDEAKEEQTTGTVEMISHLSTSADTSEASYLAYINFVPNEDVRIGMTAVVSTIDEVAEEPEL